MSADDAGARSAPTPPLTSESRVGWQADGSYLPCPDCGLVPKPDESEAPGFAVPVLPRSPGSVIHKGTCPRVTLPPDVQRKLLDDLAEMDRVRRRGAAEAANYVIG